ncbi:MAG: DNA polymerase III subunit alpha, partial [Peptococcaceae bacterium]|nr:DNA polymerase III subunit alpha [Peptococcaceae bacterium]
AYQTAYLKANYPLEFMTSLLSSVIGSPEKVSFYIQEAKNSGIEILPPDVQFSYNDFTIENNAIRFGLEAIRNVGSNLVEAIVKERQKGPFTSFYDFVVRIDSRLLNKRALESLIKAGAFGSLGNRAQIMRVVDQVLELAQNRQKDQQRGQISLFDLDQNLDQGIELPDVPEFSEKEIMKMEKEFMGIYLTTHPLLSVRDFLQNATTSDIISCLESNEERKVILGGIITSFRPTITKKGEMMASFLLEDLTGTIEVLIFPKIFAEVGSLENDQIVLVHGRYYINDEEKKIIAEKVVLVEENVEQDVESLTSAGVDPQEHVLQPKSEKLFLKLEHNSKELTDPIMKTLKAYPGNKPVYFYFADSQKVFEVNKNYYIDYKPELEKELVVLLGKENVKWK